MSKRISCQPGESKPFKPGLVLPPASHVQKGFHPTLLQKLICASSSKLVCSTMRLSNFRASVTVRRSRTRHAARYGSTAIIQARHPCRQIESTRGVISVIVIFRKQLWKALGTGLYTAHKKARFPHARGYIIA